MARMRNFCGMLILSLLLLVSFADAKPAGYTLSDPARSQLFNDGWTFTLEPHTVSVPVQLPHDFSITQGFDGELASGTGYLPGGVGWYSRLFKVDDSYAGKKIYIHFEGVYCNSTVWCNGTELGFRPNGYIPFTYEITDLVKFDSENEIRVKVDHSKYIDSRWYTGSGIYRDVYIIAKDPVHIAEYGVYVTTPQVSDESATVKAQVTMKNTTADTVAGNLSCGFWGLQNGEPALQSVELKPGVDTVVDVELKVSSPELWSPDSPKLYTLAVSLSCPEQGYRDVDSVNFGIRYFDFDNDNGFTFNGDPAIMKGVCVHHCAGTLGAAVPKAVWYDRLKTLKACGCNAIRMSHNPHDPKLFDLCDEMGFFVMAEAFDEWHGGKRKWINGWNGGKAATCGYHEYFEQWAERDLSDMMLRDRNHPSIVMWSIGNEIDYPSDPFPANDLSLVQWAYRLREVVKKYDLTRPVTAASSSPLTNLYLHVLDVVGYNYKEDLYAEHAAKYPERVIIGSENGHGYDAWMAVKNNPRIASQFLWTGIDYIGESAVWHDDRWGYNRGSRSGLLDLAGFPKARYYYRKSMWTDEPMVYGECFRPEFLEVYSNCPEVTVIVDGKQLKKVAMEKNRSTIELEDSSYKTIELKVQTADGKTIEYSIVKGGEPVRLQMTLDKTVITKNGHDVVHAVIELVDADGNVVTDDDRDISVSVVNGVLLGLENGNQGDVSTYNRKSRKTYHGRLMAYFTSDGSDWPVIIGAGASGEGVEPASGGVTIGLGGI